MEGDKDRTSEKKAIVVGPWGGNGGTDWDDGSYNGVREITVIYGRCIDSVTIVYDKNGKPVSAEKHGGSGGNNSAEIKLQFPEEFLTSVSGHYCPVARVEAMLSGPSHLRVTQEHMDLLEWKKGPHSLYLWKEGRLWDSKGGAVGILMPLVSIFREPKRPKSCRKFNRGSEDSPALYNLLALEMAKKLELNLSSLRCRRNAKDHL